MTLTRRLALALLGTTFFCLPAPTATAQSSTGILLLAHGGKPEWNTRVQELARAVDADQPTEVAFGMATRANIQAAIDRLVARKVARIVAVPLFVSSHSSVITSTEYLLGLRTEMPEDLHVFARMSHGPHGHGAPASSTSTPATATAHAAHAPAGSRAGHEPARAGERVDGTQPVVSPVPIRMTPALNSHPYVSAIAADRARVISETPTNEVVVLVAHGPVRDDDNARWLRELEFVAARVKAAAPYAAVEYLTVRDDAPKPIRDAAAAELRGVVERHAGLGRRVLIVPMLLSFGGIEQGLRTRLDGLSYAMPDQGLMPDERILAWVREMASDVPVAPR